MSDSITERLADTPRTTANLSVQDFAWSANTNGKRTRIARLRADVALKLLGRAANKPLALAIPAYEQAGTTNGTGGDTESFSVSNAVIDCPNTASIVVWLDGEYYGQPETLDRSAGSFEVTDDDPNSTVHVFYIPRAAGTLEFEKAVDGATSTSQSLGTYSLTSIHQRDFSENALYFDFPHSGDFEQFVAGDMTLDVYLNAPYITRYEDPDGDGAVATNALLNFSALQAQESVQGFKAAVKAEM